MKKKVIISVGMILLVLICMIGLFALRPAKVNGIKLEKEDYTDVFEEDGEITVRDEVPVYAMLQKKVAGVKVEEGQIVKQGDVLFTIDDTELGFQMENLLGQKNALLGQKTSEGEKTNVHQIDAQKGNVELAKANLADAVKKYKDCITLFNQGCISKYELEAAKKLKGDAEKNLKIQNATLQSLQSDNFMTPGVQKQYEGSLQQINSQIDLLNYQIEQCLVKSPIDGTVCELHLKKGEIPSLDVAVLKVFRPENYKVEVFVLSKYVVGLRENMQADIIRKIKGQEVRFSGSIENIAPTAVETVSTLGLIEQRVKVIVSIDGNCADVLRPGDNVDVVFTAYTKKDCLIIPKEAAFPVTDGEAVWVIEDGKAVLRVIEKAYEADQKIVIESGLSEGDYVVYPLDDIEIEEGMREYPL